MRAKSETCGEIKINTAVDFLEIKIPNLIHVGDGFCKTRDSPNDTKLTVATIEIFHLPPFV